MSAYLIGLLSAWSVIWVGALLIFRDARSEFKRIERRHGNQTEKDQGGARSENGYIVSSGVDMNGKQDFRGRGDSKNITKPSTNSQGAQDISSELNSSLSTSSPDVSTYYVWQTLPPTFFHRLGWVLDLMFSVRGVGWSFQNPNLPPPPLSIRSTLHPPFPSSAIPHSNTPTRGVRLRRSLISLALHWIALDMMKYLVLKDPYFLSLHSPGALSPFPFPAFTRVALSLVATNIGLSFILGLPSLFANLLGPRILGTYADPWLYPPFFGPMSEIYKKGLAGMWGIWWHQTFRFGFESAGDFLAKAFGKGWEKNTEKGAALRFLTAFGLSGCLHASASYTTLPKTSPRNAFLYFAVQPIGILIQRTASLYLRKTGWRDRIPDRARGIGNVVFVVAWSWFTGPYIANEFALSGLWLFETVPISFWHGKWWLWTGLFQWYSGGEWWWQRGWAI